MENLIDQWKTRKNSQLKLHQKLVFKLARLNESRLKTLSMGLHKRIFSFIDCLECANCCKSIPPIVNETDIRRISKFLGLKVTTFKQNYVICDEDMDMVFKDSPCVFLQSNNKCEIYEYRPKSCREYPHTEDFEFIKNINLHAINSRYCPAVFHILDDLSKKI